MGSTGASALILAVLVCRPLCSAAFQRQDSQRLSQHAASLPSTCDRPSKLQCIVHSEAAADVAPALYLLRDGLGRAAPPPQCLGWTPERFAAHYATAASLPLDEKWWDPSVARLFVPNRSDFERALQPAGYSGARLRLRSFMLSLMAGDPADVAVLGGSMTKGSHAAASWPRLLQEHARSLGHNFTVHNLAVNAAGSEWAVNNIVPYHPMINRSGLVIIDTSINDQKDWFRYADLDKGRNTYDDLLQQLLELPHRPAVIDLATLHFGKAEYNKFGGAVRCSDTLGDFPHARAEAFQVPIVSFPDAMCRCCGRTGLWFGNQHPSATTHDAVARVLLGAFGLEMERTCAPDGLLVADHPPIARAMQTTPFAKCLRAQEGTNVDFTVLESAEEGAPFVGEAGGWQFTRDLPTKPFGWLMPSGSPPGGTVSFKVDTSRSGWIRLDYLSTYENIGSVTCWVDGVDDRSGGCFVNATLLGDFSVIRSAYFGLPGGLGARFLRCRSHGGKFKVMGIASC